LLAALPLGDEDGATAVPPRFTGGLEPLLRSQAFSSTLLREMSLAQIPRPLARVVEAATPDKTLLLRFFDLR